MRTLDTLHIASRHQAYFVTVPGTTSADQLSVISFDAVETLGAPYRITIALTHPQALARADYLNKPAGFTISPSDGEPRSFSGCITQFTHVRRTADFHQYQLVIEPQVARLRLTQASRIYQHKSAPQIIEAILRRHGLDGNQFLFKTRRTYPVHAFRLQYQMSDWDYIDLLMRQEGLYCYFQNGKFGDIAVFADDIDHYLYQPELRVPYRETAGLEADTETVMQLRTHSQTVVQSVGVADYHPGDAWERFKEDCNLARTDTTTYGRTYRYGSHHLDQAGAAWEAQLRHEAALAAQITYSGHSNVLALRPARILRMDYDLPDAPNGQVITSMTHRGARDTAYSNTYTAIPANRRYRLPLNEHTWPRIAGTLSARVTSPSEYPYAYLTKDGHYTVRFDFDFEDWNPGGESVPLRLAKPFAGAYETGFHFPVIEGTEAAIAFMDGNPNKPYIAHLHHNSRHPDHITSQDRWLSRNVIRTQSDNKLQMEDWKGEEHVKLSTEHAGKSQLTLGHMVEGSKTEGKRAKRGDGFELRTDAHGAIRAGKGLLLTTNSRSGAKGKQLDMQEAMAQLNAAHGQTETLAQAANVAGADPNDAKAMYEILLNQISDLRRAVMLLTAKSSIALTTPHSVLHTAGKNVGITAGENADIGVLKKFRVAAGEAVSLFAHKMGMKLIAAKGQVKIQAQSDEMSLNALKDLTLTSTNGKLILAADKEIWIGAGGSYIRINGNRIENGTPGDIIEKCAHWSTDEPATQRISSHLPVNDLRELLPAQALALTSLSSPAGNLPPGRPYKLYAEGRLIDEGLINEDGQIDIKHHPGIKSYRLELPNSGTYHLHPLDEYRGDESNGKLANAGLHFHESGEEGSKKDRAEHRRDYNRHVLATQQQQKDAT